jgi:ABC-type multidrug transport system permease subunit
MIAVPLTEGSHTVSFIYHNAAFALGWKVSFACFAIFALLILLIYKPHLKMKHGKYEK